MLDENLRLKIYQLAVNGICQRKIGSILILSRQDVYYHIRFLIKNGYLLCKNPYGNPKQYIATDKTYNSSTEGCKNHGRGGRQNDVCRVHQIGYICNIIKGPDNNIRWEKSFKNNGTSFFQLHWDTDLGKVTFRMIFTKKSKKLILWIPEKYLNNNQLSHWDVFISKYVKVFYNEFQKRYDCVLGSLKPYQKPEFAFEESPEFLFLAHKYNVSNDNSWVDESEGSPEWETDDISLAKVRLELPERVLRLESMVIRLDKSISRIERSVNGLVNLFSVPVLKDEFKDVV